MDRALLERAIAFHGHYCPGLLTGFRAAQIAMKALGVERAYDEELVAIVETDACGVDAIQVVTGCTLGKGNLILRDWGKQVFTFGRRCDGRMVRVAQRYGATARAGDEMLEDAERRRQLCARMEQMSDEELFDVQWVGGLLPETARIMRTVCCSQCGERVMDARVRLCDGQPLCPECYGPVYRRWAD